MEKKKGKHSLALEGFKKKRTVIYIPREFNRKPRREVRYLIEKPSSGKAAAAVRSKTLSQKKKNNKKCKR